MITINNSMELLTASINEAYLEKEEGPERVLIIRFPKSEFKEEQAVLIAEEATTVEHTTKEKVTVYYVGDIIQKKISPYFMDIWLKNPEVSVSDNLNTKVLELEAIVNTLVGGEDE